MSLELFKKQLKTGDFSNVYLFYGEEAFLKEYYLNQLKHKLVEESFADFNLNVFTGKHVDMQQIWDAVESLPVMAQYKMIVSKDSGLFKSPRAAEKEFWENILADIPPHACVVFYETEVDKRSKLYKLIKKNCLAVEFKYQKTIDLVNWVERVLTSYDKKMSKQDIYYLLEHCDTGMTNVKNEIDKLVSYCRERKYISREDIDKICTKSTESRVFHMIDALMENNTQRALESLNDMMILREPVVKILALMARHFSGVLKVKLMMDQGMSTGEITSHMGMAPFVVKKYMKQAGHFSARYLHDMLHECVKIDTAVKSGKVSEKVVLQTLVVQCGSRMGR